MLVENVTKILAILTIVGDVILAGALVSWIGAKLGNKKCGDWWMSLLHWLKPRALMLGFVVALIATTGSLFYSEIAGYAPCMLCWYQRIMMYPQVLLLGMAQAKKDAGIAAYGLVLSTVGLVIAGFHYIEQVTYNPLLPCSDLGYAASCTDRFFLNFGYITIPMMAMTAFGLIILAMLSVKKKG